MAKSDDHKKVVGRPKFKSPEKLRKSVFKPSIRSSVRPRSFGGHQ